MYTFNELLSKVKDYNPNADFDRLKSAWEFTKLAHHGQERLSGDPFISHPLTVAMFLAEWRLDTTSITAALLHDTVEDGGAKIKDLENEFGQEVAKIVNGVTKISELRLQGNKEEIFVENLRKMILVMAQDLRVVLVKLADRLHNMKTLDSLPTEKRVRISKNTLEIYAPLADRLGMGKVKGELEDLAFPYVYPDEYQKLKKYSAPAFKKADEVIDKMRKKLLKELAAQQVKAEINARAKHFYSLWLKLQRSEVAGDLSKVYDIAAMRILAPSIAACYTALGVVHKVYRPAPHAGFSDFIAQPKPNGYRSIHTKVFGPEGNIVEVQIRTHEMHDEAENGVAAHWHYSDIKTKEGTKNELVEKGVFVPQEKLVWVKQLVAWQDEIADSEEFLKAVKFDALSHRNFIFSPKGDVYDLPAGATPVDFAYTVHTDLGDSIAGAKVDGKLVSLDYQLHSGQVVEILKGKNKKPNVDWLEFVKTTIAKRHINKHLRKKN